jgi:hypothetical protein
MQNLGEFCLVPMPWWQKTEIGSAAAVAFSAVAKVLEYFIQEIEEPLNKKSDKLLPEDKLPFPKSAGAAEGILGVCSCRSVPPLTAAKCVEMEKRDLL